MEPPALWELRGLERAWTLPPLGMVHLGRQNAAAAPPPPPSSSAVATEARGRGVPVDVHIVLPVDSVSRTHATLERTDMHAPWRLHDTGSRFGTIHNGRPVPSGDGAVGVSVGDGDVLELGGVSCKLTYGARVFDATEHDPRQAKASLTTRRSRARVAGRASSPGRAAFASAQRCQAHPRALHVEPQRPDQRHRELSRLRTQYAMAASGGPAAVADVGDRAGRGAKRRACAQVSRCCLCGTRRARTLSWSRPA